MKPKDGPREVTGQTAGAVRHQFTGLPELRSGWVYAYVCEGPVKPPSARVVTQAGLSLPPQSGAVERPSVAPVAALPRLPSDTKTMPCRNSVPACACVCVCVRTREGARQTGLSRWPLRCPSGRPASFAVGYISKPKSTSGGWARVCACVRVRGSRPTGSGVCGWGCAGESHHRQVHSREAGRCLLTATDPAALSAPRFPPPNEGLEPHTGYL